MEKTFNVEQKVHLQSGTKMALEVDFTKLSGQTIYELAKHGLKQKLADAGADPSVNSQEAAEKTWKKIQDEGFVMGQSRGGGARLTPVEKEARAIVADILVNQKGLKRADAEKFAKDWRKVVTSEAGQGKILAKAEKNVKDREVKEEYDVTLPDQE